VVLGELTRVPVMIKVGRRESAEGGADVDIIKELQLSAQERRQKVIGFGETSREFQLGEMNWEV